MISPPTYSKKNILFMIIAIDYDHTYTADPNLWEIFFRIAKLSGHQVICVTGRNCWSLDMQLNPLPHNMPIVYSGKELKEKAALKAGYKVDIWIDDMPGTIQETKILTDNLD